MLWIFKKNLLRPVTPVLTPKPTDYRCLNILLTEHISPDLPINSHSKIGPVLSLAIGSEISMIFIIQPIAFTLTIKFGKKYNYYQQILYDIFLKTNVLPEYLLQHQ